MQGSFSLAQLEGRQREKGRCAAGRRHQALPPRALKAGRRVPMVPHRTPQSPLSRLPGPTVTTVGSYEASEGCGRKRGQRWGALERRGMQTMEGEFPSLLCPLHPGALFSPLPGPFLTTLCHPSPALLGRRLREKLRARLSWALIRSPVNQVVGPLGAWGKRFLGGAERQLGGAGAAQPPSLTPAWEGTTHALPAAPPHPGHGCSSPVLLSLFPTLAPSDLVSFPWLFHRILCSPPSSPPVLPCGPTFI